MKNTGYIAISVSIIVALVMVWFLKTALKEKDIEINISENEEELSLTASFPEEYSERVHDYVRSELKMSDLSDFHYLEIKNYQTPDRKMRFHIMARSGYIKIVLDRTENSEYAYRKLRGTADGVKEILAQ